MEHLQPQPNQTDEFLRNIGKGDVFVMEPRDCSPPVFPRKGADMFEHTRYILGNLGVAGEALAGTRQNVEPNETIESLASGKPAFIELGLDTVSPALQRAAEIFKPEQIGALIKTDYVNGMFDTSKFTLFPTAAIDGRNYRILWAKVGIDEVQQQCALDELTVPTKVIHDGQTAWAMMEYVQNGEMPESITPTELDDWVQRVASAQIDLGVDIGDDDVTLDNFLRVDGQLRWCDGNIMDAAAIDAEKSAELAEKFRRILTRFIV